MCFTSSFLCRRGHRFGGTKTNCIAHCSARMRVQIHSSLARKSMTQMQNRSPRQVLTARPDDDNFWWPEGLEDDRVRFRSPHRSRPGQAENEAERDDEVNAGRTAACKQKKKRRTQGTGRRFACVCGVATGRGSIGGVVWVLVAFAIHRQIGNHACGSRGVTGLGVCKMAKDGRAGTASRVLAGGWQLCAFFASNWCRDLFVKPVCRRTGGPG